MNKKYKDKKITMAHGSGGKASSDLITDIFVNTFNNDYLATMEDQARFDMPPGQIALTTDSFVVSPLFFNGGNIGKLGYEWSETFVSNLWFDFRRRVSYRNTRCNYKINARNCRAGWY